MTTDPEPVGNPPTPDSPTSAAGRAEEPAADAETEARSEAAARENVTERGLRGRFGTIVVRAMPWLSLVWGLVSGVLVARRFENAGRVLAFAVGLLAASVLLGAWGSWSSRRARRFLEGSSDAGPRGWGLGSLVARHEERIGWLVTSGKQISSQYILMFAIPFLWNTRAWPYLALAVALAATTLWDPLFFRIVRFQAYRLLLRAAGMALAISFLVGVLFPTVVALYDELALFGAIVGAVPVSVLGRRRFVTIGGVASSFAPLALLAACAFAHVRVAGIWRFPVLSLWLKAPSFELQDVNGQWITGPKRNAPLGGDEVRTTLVEGGRLCCVTPLVASRHLLSEVVHEWLVDGRTLDTIELPPVRGRDESSAYRTFSCKRNVPGPDLATVTCRVWVGPRNGPRVFVGDVPFGGS